MFKGSKWFQKELGAESRWFLSSESFLLVFWRGQFDTERLFDLDSDLRMIQFYDSVLAMTPQFRVLFRICSGCGEEGCHFFNGVSDVFIRFSPYGKCIIPFLIPYPAI